jgi:transketolase
MRNAFAKAITEQAAKDCRIVLLSGDIGNRLFDEFKAAHPTRFYNCGVAEANMIGVAAGLAMNGFRPFVYTIASFVTYRVVEQIRLDCGYHHLPVTIVGTGAGLSYASLGATHHTLEDIAMLRSIPGMKVLCPADAFEIKAAIPEILKQNDPVYLRIGKKGEPVIHREPLTNFKIGEALKLRAGTDLALLGVGNMIPTALEVAGLLEQSGVSSSVFSFHTVKPLDEKVIRGCFKNHKIVCTLEEHSKIGGFGSAVAEWIVDHGEMGGRLVRFGTPDAFLHEAGEQEHARKACGLLPSQIAHGLLGIFKTGPTSNEIFKSQNLISQ